MKLVVQRVKRAACDVEGKTVSTIGAGLLIYVSFKSGDTASLIPKMATKTANLRIFPDADKKMNRSLKDAGGEVLIVSQFTLEADTRKGNRPSFKDALEQGAAPGGKKILLDHLGPAETIRREGHGE